MICIWSLQGFGVFCLTKWMKRLSLNLEGEEEVLIFLKPRMVTKSAASCKVAGTKTSSFWVFVTLF